MFTVKRVVEYIFRGDIKLFLYVLMSGARCEIVNSDGKIVETLSEKPNRDVASEDRLDSSPSVRNTSLDLDYGSYNSEDCIGGSRRKTHVRTGSDFWTQLAGQTYYIDESARSSILITTKTETKLQDATTFTSAPSLSDRVRPAHLRYSVRDSNGRKNKITRFYSQDPATMGVGELRVVEPLLSSNETRASLAAVWGAPIENKKQPKKTNLSRKLSSWEESVSLERRRSVAVRGKQNDLSKVYQGIMHPQFTSLDIVDLRYCFQHPYLRLFTTLLVTFCNFLLFAEDPISHSQAESVLPLAGNVFSFIFTKYPKDWRWALVKVLMWILAILCGLVIGKLFVHTIMFGKYLRLKMFRDEQGSWILMFLTVILSVFVFSYIYNFILYVFYNNPNYFIDSSMGLTNSAVMKACACGTWLGDLMTWLMVMDVMLQDNLYPEWAVSLRTLWRSSNIPRILVFWCASALATALVVTLIVSDYISWDNFNRDFISTTELSRAFLASTILVLDLVIMMQDWDFPHFTTTVHINLPGFSVSTLEWKYAEVHLTGKWFNYGVILMVMFLDLNMWKNQIIYTPEKFGQYLGPDDKIYTVMDQKILKSGNESLWSWESRSKLNETSGLPYFREDLMMNSRYMGDPLLLKCTAFIPSILTLSLFISIIYLYGRFPIKKSLTGQDGRDMSGDVEDGRVTV